MHTQLVLRDWKWTATFVRDKMGNSAISAQFNFKGKVGDTSPTSSATAVTLKKPHLGSGNGSPYNDRRSSLLEPLLF